MSTRCNSYLKSISSIVAASVATASSIVLIAWIFDIAVLKSLLTGQAVFPAAGLVLLLNSLALLLEELPHDKTAKQVEGNFVLARLLSAVAITVSGLTLVEHGLGQSIAVPPSFIPYPERVEAPPFVGLMPPNTALCLFLTSVAIPFLRSNARYWLVELVLLSSLLIGFLGLLGYLFKIQSFYTVAFYPQMALPAVLGSLALNASTLLSNPDQGITGLTFSHFTASRPTKRSAPTSPSLSRLTSSPRLTTLWPGSNAINGSIPSRLAADARTVD